MTSPGPGRLSGEAVHDLLAKGWLTHDGMWFVHTAAEHGIDGANALNRAAIRGMAPIEVRRLAGALGVDPAALGDAGALASFLIDALEVLMPASVAGLITVSAPAPGTLRMEWPPGGCFAYRGMERAGLLEGYECGVVHRIECWLEALGIPVTTDPPTGRCRMDAGTGCATEIMLTREAGPD